MDSWPIDYRPAATPLGRGKRRTEKPQSSCNYLDVKLGSLNAVNLIEKEHRLEWTSVLKHTLPEGSSRRRTITIFPPTRPPRLCIPQTTILQRAEQGANFLHTYLPDIDIPAELIRDEISRDAEIGRKFGPFDPYVGSLLEYVPYDSETAFLAFPMGELTRELNLSSINYSEQHVVSFSPNASPVRSFKTPIQQIVSSKDIPDCSELNSYLAVRTFEMTSVMKVMAFDASTQSTQVAELANIVQADTTDRPIVDMKLATRPLEALTITDTGALYKFSFADGKKGVSIVRPAASTDTEPTSDVFWRIALGENGVDCFLASSKDVKLQDIRSRTSFDLFTVPGQQDVLTSIDYGGDNILRLCSTRDIVWMDKRYPNRPLLGYRHGRKYDRSLEARSVQLQSQSTLLTSRNNALVTVYDVSRSAERLTHMTKLPYCLFPDKSVGASCIGSVSFQHPHSSNENVCLVRVSDEGSLHYIDLTTPLNEDATIKTLWSADVKDLDARMQNLCPDVGPLGAHDFTETDFRPAYEAIFCAHQETQTEEESGEAVYDLLDQMPHFWKQLDPPVEYMLTLFDTVFLSGPQPTQASRADFLTQSIINSKRGYRALLQDRLSPRCLMKDASWHYNISSTVKRLGLDFTGDIRSCTEALHKYDLIADPERDARSVRWENDAREQLAVDLTLSGDVFSGQPFSTYPNGSSELEAMTETLSLASKPPSVKFGYLHPVLKSAVDHYHERTEDNEVVFTSGVQALLKDWVVGTDPQIPSRKDHSHYTTRSNGGTLSFADQAVRKAVVSQTPRLFSSQRPPLIVASTVDLPTQPDFSGRGFSVDDFRAPRVPVRSESQRVVNVPEPLDSSQDYMTSTQILPGPYGGRPSLGKKKMAKRRLGGF